MKYWIGYLFFCSFFTVAEVNKNIPVYINTTASNPYVVVYNTAGKTQITYTNGDSDNLEFFILLCDGKRKSIDAQYYVFNDGFQLTQANYFTIQRYPRGWLKMTPPYYPPSVVLYDSGMTLDYTRFSKTIDRLLEEGDWGIVLTFETLLNENDIVTQGWSQVIPSEAFRKGFYKQDLTSCRNAKFRSITPLIKIGDNHE